MNQLRAVALAAFFLGVGRAGEPLVPMHVLLAAGILLLVAISLEQRVTTLVIFLVGFVGVLLACYLQHGDVYIGTGVLALGLGLLAASSFGRRTAPVAILVMGAVVGTGVFFLI